MNVSEQYGWMFDSMFCDIRSSTAAIGLEFEASIKCVSIDKDSISVVITYNDCYYEIVIGIDEFANRPTLIVMLYRCIANNKTMTIRAFRYDKKREVDFKY